MASIRLHVSAARWPLWSTPAPMFVPGVEEPFKNGVVSLWTQPLSSSSTWCHDHCPTFHFSCACPTLCACLQMLPAPPRHRSELLSVNCAGLKWGAMSGVQTHVYAAGCLYVLAQVRGPWLLFVMVMGVHVCAGMFVLGSLCSDDSHFKPVCEDSGNRLVHISVVLLFRRILGTWPQ